MILTKRFYIFLFIAFLGLQAARTANAEVPFRGFSDFSLIYDDLAKNSSFQIHDVDVFVGGAVDKNITYLAEINFQPGFDGVGVDLERTLVSYAVNPWLKVSLGRFHTALGYWNDTYHHGAYLATSATRPVMERFEDSGGILPIHNTGIELRGNGLVGSGNLGYIFNIGNGRGPVKDPPSFFNSYNKSKSISGVLYYEFTNGLRVGASYWRSDLPGGAGLNGDSTVNANAVGPAGTENIYGVHAVYNSPNSEWIPEYHFMKHTYVGGTSSIPADGTIPGSAAAGTPIVNANADGSLSTNINLLYSQFGYHLGKYTPYVRYEIDATNTADAYLNASPGYNAQGLLATTRYYVIGSRYELSAASALKLEFTYISSGAPIFQANLPAVASTKTTNYDVNLNWSLAW